MPIKWCSVFWAHKYSNIPLLSILVLKYLPPGTIITRIYRICPEMEDEPETGRGGNLLCVGEIGGQ